MTSPTPKPIAFVGPWDLHPELPVLGQPGERLILLIESQEKSRALPYHAQKLVLVLSAMHHFADPLRAKGYEVRIRNAANYVAGITEVAIETGARKVFAMRPREWSIDQKISAMARNPENHFETEIVEEGEPFFLLTRSEFMKWVESEPKTSLRMDRFYKMMRHRTGWLMNGNKPIGGKYSFDSDNRKPPPKSVTPPTPLHFIPDATTEDAIARVRSWKMGWGEVEPFVWPVTREQALEQLEHFLLTRSALFGEYQDAMLKGETSMWHSLLSVPMNLGLISPKEVVLRVLSAYEQNLLPLNAAEGFLRQVIGWREFIRGVYWLRMPDLRTSNQLGAKRKLPVWYWEPEQSVMACVNDSVGQVKRTGYAHHIQRLMVLGNFALLADIDPIEVSHWFWAGFVDAYEWVELPNVHGMALFADGTFTTKPYAASGAYINKMSNYCGGCAFDVKQRRGPDACPFNFLFWDFLARHEERFLKHPRIGALYRTWQRFSEEERLQIRASARHFLETMPPAAAYHFRDDAG